MIDETTVVANQSVNSFAVTAPDATKIEAQAEESMNVSQVDLSNLDVLLKMHEVTLKHQIEATRNLEEERELNKRLIKEIQKREYEKEVLRKIVEQQQIENTVK